MNEGNQHPTVPQGDSNWQYVPGPEQQYAPAPPAPMEPQPVYPQEVTWTASEFIAHDKGARWYALFALGVAALMIVIHFITHDLISVLVIAALAVLFGFSAARKPRILTYQLTTGGIVIGQKFYPYSDFKSFSVLHEGPFSSITFMPMKRFMPPLSVYYEQKDEQAIFVVLANHLPFEEQGNDVIDHIARRLRF